jgi:hypothetical protein
MWQERSKMKSLLGIPSITFTFEETANAPIRVKDYDEVGLYRGV